jgi:hypothetical protein
VRTIAAAWTGKNYRTVLGDLGPGMVIHIEPKMILPWGFFQLEEAVVVTPRESDYLTVPAPDRLSVVARAAGDR